MKSKNVTIWLIAIANMLVLLGPLAGQSWGDFALTGDEWITVDWLHYQGTLYDRIRASIVTDGWVYYLDAYNSSVVDMSGGKVNYLTAYNFSIANISGGWVKENLYTYNSSTVNISGGTVEYLNAYDESAVGISGGEVKYLSAYDSSTVDMSSGYVAHLNAFNFSSVDMSGGRVAHLGSCDSSTLDISGGIVSSSLWACNSSAVDISGGTVNYLYAWNSSTVTFHGQNFSGSGGLFLYGDRVLGTGMLAGEWMDGTPWAVNILTNEPTATIRAIPEPATLLLLGLGAVLLRKRR